MKVLVTGSRHWPYADKHIVRDALIACGATIVVHGDARGADAQAKAIAIELGLEQRPYPADWKTYGRAAGGIRNQEMLDSEHLPGEPVAVVLAFPREDSIGTWDMVERAEHAGIEVRGFGEWYGAGGAAPRLPPLQLSPQKR
jgi:hypothetical protein